MNEIALLIADGPILAREHPRLRSTLERAARRGELARVLPGVYVPATMATDPRWLMWAVCRTDPDAVICGRAARSLHLTGATADRIEVATPHRRVPHRGFVFVRRRIPVDDVVRRGELRVTSPALTALDLAAKDGGETIDDLLRTRALTVPQLEAALCSAPHRRGNRVRRRVVQRSRTEPWSQGERRLHALLEAARVPTWVANHAVRLDGCRYYLDVVFRGRRVALEFDGLRYHNAGTASEDLQRQNRLILAGWTILRFTWTMLDQPEEVVRAVRAALRLRPATGAR